MLCLILIYYIIIYYVNLAWKEFDVDIIALPRQDDDDDDDDDSCFTATFVHKVG